MPASRWPPKSDFMKLLVDARCSDRGLLDGLAIGRSPESGLVETAVVARHLQEQARRHEAGAVDRGERLEPPHDGGQAEAVGVPQEAAAERREAGPQDHPQID